MSQPRRAALFVCVAMVAALAAVRAQQPAPEVAPVLTVEQMEKFLLEAKVVRTRSLSVGVTNSRRATLTDGQITHDAHVQTIDDFKPTFSAPTYTEVAFRDSYRFNIAAFRLARLLGLDNVPVSVARTFERQQASLTWWVDDVAMDEMERRKRGATDPKPDRWNHYQYRMRVFDELILNRDRNQGNLVYTSDWTMWMIDHTRSFRLQTTLANPAQLTRVERPLFERLQALTPEELAKAVGTTLERGERQALLTRRDAIIKIFRARIAERGEEAVLYTYQP